MRHVDIWSKGDVIDFVIDLAKQGIVKECAYLVVKQEYARAFYPRCVEKLARRIEAKNVTTRVTAYGAPSSYHWPRCPENCRLFQRVEDFEESLIGEEMHARMVEELPKQAIPRSKEVFIIHGRDETNLLRLEKLLRDRWHLNPIVLKAEPEKGRTVIEKFEQEAKRASYAIALFTPDDQIKLSETEYMQARPNVIFELGWFYGQLERQRVCILFKVGTKIHSDLRGIITIEFKETVDETIVRLENELKAAGLVEA